MRVAYVCTDPGVPVFGNKGASVHAQAVLSNLVSRDAEVHLLTPRPGGDAPPQLRGVQVHRLPAVAGETAAAREAAARRSDAAVGPVLEELSRGSGIDLVYERYALWGRTATEWAARSAVTSVLEVNAPLPREQAAHRTLQDREGAEAVARAACGLASTVVCVSEPVSSWVRSLGADPGRVHTVPNGVSCSRLLPVPVRADPDPFTLGFVGTFKPWHGIDILVRALRLLRDDDPSYTLLLVGDGPSRQVLSALVTELGLDDVVTMTGAVDPTRVPDLLARMDVAVAPYPEMAGFYFSPLKVYEYLAAGLPTVASDVGQLREILQHGHLGVLTPPGDPGALASAVADLRRQPSLRADLASRARRTAEREHDWDHVVSRILSLAEADGAHATT